MILVILMNYSESKGAGDVSFLTDSTEGKDGTKEVIMDYVISWMLRRAQTVCTEEKPILFNYCRKFLEKLIGREIHPKEEVIVETWKQYGRIDLWAYVKISEEEHDILIEDKYYTAVHDDQLIRYKGIFDNWLNIHRPKTPVRYRHYWLLSCFDNQESSVGIYNADLKKSGFEPLFWDDMLKSMGLDSDNPQPSESDIYNEFWLATW